MNNIFTPKQDEELNIAYSRIKANKAMGEVSDASGKIINYGDKKNVEYAMSKGWKPKEVLDTNIVVEGLSTPDITNQLPSQTAADQANKIYANNILTDAQQTYDSLQKEIDAIRSRQIQQAQQRKLEADQQISQYNQQIQPNIDAFSENLNKQRISIEKTYTQDYYDQLLDEKKNITRDIINYSKMLTTEIEANANQPALARIQSGREANIIQGYQAKLSIKNAALNAIDGNFTFASDILNQGIARLNSYYEQKVNFNRLVNQVFDTDEVKRLTEQSIADIKAKQKEINETKNIVLEFMSDPTTALIASKAGLSLLDNKDQIATKLNKFYIKNPGYQPENIKANQVLIAKYPDAGINIYDTQDIVKAKLSRSQIYLQDVAKGSQDLIKNGYKVDENGQLTIDYINLIQDATAEQIAEAIKQVESGGDYDAIGDNGTSKGAYQFQKYTWEQYSREYAASVLKQSVRSLPMTPQNQDAVAIFKIKQWLNQGYTPDQVIAAWNAGEGTLNKGYQNLIGYNEKIGVNYNVPAYVNKVAKVLTEKFNIKSTPEQGSMGQIDKIAQDWAENIRDGKAKFSDITDNLEKQNPGLKNKINSILKTLPPSKAQIDAAKNFLDKLIELRDHPGLNSAVGPIKIARIPIADIFGAKQAFLGKASTIISKKSLDSLIAAKSQGATFGALSEKEMQILKSAGSTLSAWARENKEGKIKYFAVSEKEFKNELNTLINEYQKIINEAEGMQSLETYLKINPQKIEEYNLIAKNNPNLSDNEILQALNVE